MSDGGTLSRTLLRAHNDRMPTSTSVAGQISGRPADQRVDGPVSAPRSTAPAGSPAGSRAGSPAGSPAVLEPAVGAALGAGCVTVAAAGLWLAVVPGEGSLAGLMSANVVDNAINGVTLGALAGVLIAMRPSNRLGWLVLLVAWGNALAIFGSGWGLASYHLDLPGRALFAWLASWPWAPALLAGPALVALLYPSGRTTSSFAHRLAGLSVTAAVTVGVCFMLLDEPYDTVLPGRRLGENPISHGHLQLPLTVLAAVAALTGAVVAVLAWGHTLRRIWRAQSPEREQLAWLLAMVAPVLVVAPLNAPALTFAVQVISPVGLVIGIVRYQLFDIKLVLRSGLLYGALTGLAAAVYFGLVALITTITPRGTVPSLFAIAAVGLVVVPMHRVLQGFLGRLVYGDRADPLRALSRVAAGIRMVDAEDPSGLRAMLAGIATALRSPYVVLHDAGGRQVTGVGSYGDQPLHSVELEHAGAPVGRLTLAGRTPRDPLGPADRRLVTALAGPVAAAVGASVAARELAESRSRVLAVRETERRRLREDLHDGLGPSLSGVALGLEAARRSVGTNPERVPEILEVLHGEVDLLVAEVRGIIDDLGPGQVDLLAAIRRHVDAITAASDAGASDVGASDVGADLAVELTVSADLGAVPGEVAVAAHRIAGEALTNAARHAHAQKITVTLTGQGDHLFLEIVDDGTGEVAPRPGGVGLQSMRQRAESVGGALTVSAVPGVGTRVHALLPWQGAR